MNPDTRWAIVERLLHEDRPCLSDRVAGCLVLLYGQQLSRIVAITTDQVITVDGDVYLNLGASQTIVPEPLGGLVTQLAAHRRPYTVSRITRPQPLAVAGAAPRPPASPRRARPAAPPHRHPHHARPPCRPLHLAAQLPAAVLAELLHLKPTTAVRWVAAAGGDWSTYAAQVARDR
jgi:hypothetical protein